MPTVEQKAAHPWAGNPTPAGPCPSPLHLCLASRATCPWQPPPPTEFSCPPQHPTPTRPPPTADTYPGACPQGLQGKVHPNSYQELLWAEAITERVSPSIAGHIPPH